jgi:CelD/BcsL family acetyltransferase involved in cellulose biosynthesis
MQLEVIPYSPQLAAHFADTWRRVASQAPGASAFTSAEWITTWLAVYGPSLAPELLLWRTLEGEPAAVCLLGRRPVSIGLCRTNALFLNATGEQQVGSEHNRVLCARADEDQVFASLVAHARTRGADLLRVVGFTEATLSALRCAWPQASLGESMPSEDPYIAFEPLRAAGVTYLATLSPNTRHQIRRSMRLFEERGGRCAIERAADPAQAAVWLAELQQLHEARWAAKNKTSTFMSPQARTFHAALIERCLTAGGCEDLAVDLLRVRFGAETIALLYNLRFRDVVSFYQAGLKFESGNNCRPGLVAHALAIQYYLDSGAREYDFLAGEPDPVRYKRSLATDARTLIWAELSAPTRRMACIARARRLGKFATRIRAKIAFTALRADARARKPQ